LTSTFDLSYKPHMTPEKRAEKEAAIEILLLTKVAEQKLVAGYAELFALNPKDHTWASLEAAASSLRFTEAVIQDIYKELNS
jgi:hypothetical protein